MNNFLHAFAQANPTDGKWLFQSEKINTVMVVILVIWLGIILYLLRLGRKVSKIEKEIQRREGQNQLRQ